MRQDKYKGELKSKNWVGRLYKDGKQKISSSGTPNLDEAIPILEKWFDDVHSEKENLETQSSTPTTEKIETKTETEIKPEQQIQKPIAEQSKPKVENVAVVSQNLTSEDASETKPKNILEKLKNIKFKAPSFGKGEVKKLNFKPNTGKVKEKFNNFLKARLGKKQHKEKKLLELKLPIKK